MIGTGSTSRRRRGATLTAVLLALGCTDYDQATGPAGDGARPVRGTVVDLSQPRRLRPDQELRIQRLGDNGVQNRASLGSAGRVAPAPAPEGLSFAVAGNTTGTSLGSVVDASVAYANDVNASGMVAGDAFSTTALPVRWSTDGNATVLPLPGPGFQATAQAINDAGWVVGSYEGEVQWPGQTVFLGTPLAWDPAGAVHVLPSAPFPPDLVLDCSIGVVSPTHWAAYPTDVNAQGTIVGYGLVLGVTSDGAACNGPVYPLRWRLGSPTTAEALPNPASDIWMYPAAINDAGTILANVNGRTALLTAYVSAGDAWSPLPLPAAVDFAMAEALASNGAVLANGSGANGPAVIAWPAAGAAQVITVPSGWNSINGSGINSAGRVTGALVGEKLVGTAAYTWDAGDFSFLTVTGMSQTGATALSETDMIAGWTHAPGASTQYAARWRPSYLSYTFSGFFQPVDNPGTTNVTNSAKAGSAIPVKFKLGGDKGFVIFANGFPKFLAGGCVPNAAVDAIETTTANAGGLSYDAGSETYTYVWKTDKAWAGLCGTFKLGLKDGSTHDALFRFTK